MYFRILRHASGAKCWNNTENSNLHRLRQGLSIVLRSWVHLAYHLHGDCPFWSGTNTHAAHRRWLLGLLATRAKRGAYSAWMHWIALWVINTRQPCTCFRALEPLTFSWWEHKQLVFNPLMWWSKHFQPNFTLESLRTFLYLVTVAFLTYYFASAPVWFHEEEPQTAYPMSITRASGRSRGWRTRRTPPPPLQPEKWFFFF